MFTIVIERLGARSDGSVISIPKPGFARGSHHTLQLEAPAELGELLRVVVKQHKPGDSDVGVGW